MATRLLCDSLRAPQRSLQAPATPNAQRLRAYIRSVWAVPRSLAATRGIATCFLFLRLLRWFSSPRWLLAAYEFSGGCVGIAPRRFPDSEIPGSKPVSGSPRLIAAVHVLLRLPAPRHPPCALSSLTVSLRRTPSAATGAPLRSRSRTGYHLVGLRYCLSAWMSSIQLSTIGAPAGRRKRVLTGARPLDGSGRRRPRRLWS